MLSTIRKKIVHVLINPFTWAVFLSIALLIVIFNGDRIIDDGIERTQQIQQMLEDWRKEDPEMEKLQAEVDHDRAMAIANQSAMLDDSGRSTRHDMIEQWQETSEVPYRIRLAELALNDPELNDVPERAEEFFVAHGTTCEFLEIATGVKSSQDYVNLLTQAKSDPAVWPLVWDDPVALQIWADPDANGLTEVKFYREYRDWLADPIIALDYRNSPVSGPAEAIRKVAKIPETAETTLDKEQANLGVIGLMTLITHGKLIDRCRKVFGLNPEEIVAILHMNPDVFNDFEGDEAWVIQKSSWLNNIEKHSPSVWLAAMEFPFTLKLHIDAPHVSEDLLAKHGDKLPQILIYDLFQNKDGSYDQEVIARAAEAINVFGDVAIYIFARYKEPIWRSRMEEFLLDDEIGVRLIPFLARFEDKGFEKIEDDKDWIKKYFNKDGTPRVDPTEWITYIPGGTLYKVAENWSKGIPNERGELGWAAFDVADIALTVATFGASKAATTAGKATQAINKGADLARAGSKSAQTAKFTKWSERIAGGIKKSERLRELVKLVRSSKITGALGDFTWMGLKISINTTEALARSTRAALQKWKNVNPATKKWVYRGALGTSLFIQVSNRTLPNADKIGEGIGTTIGKWSAGITKGAGLALGEAFQEFTGTVIEPIGGKIAYWFTLILLLIFIILFIKMGNQKRKEQTPKVIV